MTSRERALLLFAAAAVVLQAPAVQAQTLAMPATRDAPGGLDASHRRSLYLTAIEGLRKEGKAHAALAHLDAFDLAFPRDEEAQLLRADCLADIKDYPAAGGLYTRLMSGRLGDRAAAGLGRIRAGQGDWSGAVDAFTLAVKRNPTSIPYLNDLGFALLEAGRAPEGLFRLRQALELGPDDRLARNNLIMALDQNGRGAEAAELLETIADRSERSAVADLLKARAAMPRRALLAAAPAVVLGPIQEETVTVASFGQLMLLPPTPAIEILPEFVPASIWAAATPADLSDAPALTEKLNARSRYHYGYRRRHAGAVRRAPVVYADRSGARPVVIPVVRPAVRARGGSRPARRSGARVVFFTPRGI